MQGSAVVSTGAIVKHGKGNGHFGAPISNGEKLVARVRCLHEGDHVLPRQSASLKRHLTEEENDICYEICKCACGRS